MVEKVRNGNDRPYHRDQFSNWKTIRVIMSILIGWAIILSIGAWLKDSSIWRPVMIMGTLVFFCGIWIAALIARNARRSN